VIVPSQAVARFLRMHGLPGDRIRVIPSAIDVRRREPAPAKNPFVLGAVGGLEYVKGIDILLAACAQLAQPVALEIFGDGDWRRRLEEQAQRLGVDARFHGHVDEVRSHVDRFDALVLASRAENLPVSILEAMSSAVPVIATRVGGVPELLNEGEAGILVESEDVDGLAEAIAAVMTDSERRTRLGRLGARRIEEHYRPADIAKQITGVYEELRGRFRDLVDSASRA
jgi:glycosyltransferase involved in cell wall biosynthesis